MGLLCKRLAIASIILTISFLSDAQAASRTRDHGVLIVRGGEKDGEKGGEKAANATKRQSFSIECNSAESGDPQAAYSVARRYLFGAGVRKNKRVGMAWLRAAATRGHGEARRLVHYSPGRMGHSRPYCRPGAAPPRGTVAPPEDIVRMVKAMAPTYGLDPELVLAVVQVESAFRTDAVSPKEAAGLMQLIPDTAERFDVRDPFNPEDNLRGGMKYLRWLLAYFRGDVTLALAGYNAGEGAVNRYRGVPPYEETRNYVELIRRLYPQTDHPFDPTVAEPSSSIPKRTAALPR